MLATMSRSRVQCDQIWQNFANLEKFDFIWQFLEGIQRNPLLNLAKNYAIGLIFIVVNDQNIENIVASGHTVRDCI